MDFSVLELFLAVSKITKITKMDNFGCGCDWLELSFLIIFFHHLLFLNQVGLFCIELALGVLNLIQDNCDEFLDLLDTVAIPRKRHIREASHDGLFEGGNLEL